MAMTAMLTIDADDCCRMGYYLEKDPGALAFASSEIQDDADVVLAAVKQDGRALQFASTRLRSDRGIVTAAIEQDWRALEFASSELQEEFLQDGTFLQKETMIAGNDYCALRVTLPTGNSCFFAAKRGDSGSMLVKRCAKRLGLRPTALLQRVKLFLGSAEMDLRTSILEWPGVTPGVLTELRAELED
mmetsp:Transcript_58165/g.138458  ORF Transcript_58165/g.138458 Transcript_58165/m.138458 type:complete len:188 (+) Transcript_58165:75-638(+)